MELKKYKIGDLVQVTRGASLGGEFYATQGNYVRLTCGNFDIEIIASKRINQKITSTIQVVSKRNFYLKRETLLRL